MLIASILYILVGMFLVSVIIVSLDESNGIYFLVALLGSLIIEGLIMPFLCSKIIRKKE